MAKEKKATKQATKKQLVTFYKLLKIEKIETHKLLKLLTVSFSVASSFFLVAFFLRW